jgi:hypothetical protein
MGTMKSKLIRYVSMTAGISLPLVVGAVALVPTASPASVTAHVTTAIVRMQDSLSSGEGPNINK